MSKAVRIHPSGPITGTICPPGSKSITNRAIICAALADGVSNLTGVLDSEDTQVMIESWRQLGVKLDHNTRTSSLRVEGTGGRLPVQDASLFVANSGTTIRFLTAALAACQGVFRLDGVARMRERPIGDLIDALNQLGGDVKSNNQTNAACPPVEIRASGLRGGVARVTGNISSQYLSGVMLASPMADADVTIVIEGELVSVPYVRMTAAVMQSFGGSVTMNLPEELHVAVASKYRGRDYAIEPDASAASYFWAAAAICGGTATVSGLSRSSLQGDVRFCEVLEKMGCDVVWGQDQIKLTCDGTLRGVDVNMADISDTVQTLAAVALFATGTTKVSGVAHNRVKETDRIGDLANELRKFGAVVDEFDDGLAIHPPAKVSAAEIETYSDHRMAMSMALVGLRVPGVQILDPECTGKTYPNYWQDLSSFANCRVDRLGG